jgi:UDP-N-acetylglucosamine acyltransferase
MERSNNVAIHPLAIVDPKAEIERDVTIGPWCHIGPDVKIGSGTVLTHGVTVTNHTIIGKNNEIGIGTSLGGNPQDFKYKGGPTRLEIGDENVFREYVTVNIGTEKGGGVTRIGSANFLMACCHVAHDCNVHNHAVIPNGVLLGGHVEVEDGVVFGGNTAVHHFTTIGKLAFIGGLTAVRHDVPPFMLFEGHPGEVLTINTVGLKRNGFSAERIKALKFAYRVLYRESKTHTEAFKRLRESEYFNPDIEYLISFISKTDAGVLGRAHQPPRR